MKITRFIILSLLCGLFVTFSSCKKDNEEPTPPNEITLNGTVYQIANVSLTSSVVGEKSSAQFTFTTAQGNKVIMVMLALDYLTAKGISGTYDLDKVKERYLDALLTNYSVTDFSQGMSMQSYNNPASGTATITDKGSNNLEVSFKFKPNSGSEIEGTYSGKVVRNI